VLQTLTGGRYAVTAPSHLAAQSGLAVMREGGNAIEAMVAAAAAIAVTYPHMNAIGGDGFWLIHVPGRAPVGIEACGPAAAAATPEYYASHGCTEIPSRGPLAANTVAGAVGGWAEALALSAELGGRMSLARLFEDAIAHAERGIAPTAGQIRLTTEKRPELENVPGFAETFMPNGAAPVPLTRFTEPRLAATLKRLAADGLDGFYRGELARSIAADLRAAGSPVAAADLEAYRARRVSPLSVQTGDATLYNMPPPTQGLASLMILALFDRLNVREADGYEYVHALVEAAKQAFLVRDAYITDPAYMTVDPTAYVAGAALAERAAAIDPARALPWPQPASAGDTIWMGAADADGIMVSYIQSTYWEFGSGVVLGETGLLWQNRGSSFRLDEGALNRLAPGRKPFHTLNPALAALEDGRVMVYGTMGGEGQPQTQSALFTRYARFGQDLQQAVTAPRWLLGRTWGAESTTLKLESRFDPAVVEALRSAGHEVEIVPPFSDLMGHAGAVLRHRNGLLEGAADPRSDGIVAAT